MKQKMYLQKRRIDPYVCGMIGIIAGAMLLRLILIALNWPTTNSDEGTIDLMARHIAFLGQHPLFYDGQNYMGPGEAYLGALFFRVLGSSLFAERLSLVLL